MTAQVDQFWEEFQSEADEHLTTADRLIDEAQSNPLSADQVAELFRGFHSLKGLARAMDLEGMEGLAHRSESLLGLVRDHGIALDADLIQGLAIAAGHLGQMLTQVVTTREDVPAPLELLAELDRLESERGGLVAPAATAAPSPSGGSDDMMSLLAELMRDLLPRIAQLAAPVVDRDATGTGDAITALGNAAEVMEMPELGEILAALSAFAERAGPETLETRVDFLARLGQQAALIGEVTGIDAGADAFAGALAPLLADTVRDQLEILAVVVVPKEATAAATLLAAIGHRRGARLLALASEAAAVSSRGEVPSSAPLVYAIDAAVAAVAGLWADPLALPDDLDEAAVATHEAEIRAALHAAPEDDAPAAAETDRHVAEIAVPEAFVPVLSAENRQDLERAVGEGQAIYQMMTDLEVYEAAGESAPLERLAELGQVITSRTVRQGERTLFEFLIVSRLAPSEMRRSIATLDPGQRWIKAVHVAGSAPDKASGEGSGEAAAGPQETARPAPKPGSTEAGMTSDAMLRVRGATIDALMSAVGHARVEAAALSQILTEDRRKLDAMTGLARMRETLPPALAAELGRHIEALRERESEMAAADARLATALSQLHADALDLRVVPVETVLAHLPRVTRELAQRQGKAVRIRLKGRDVRIDKSVVQQLLDPLMHMMRNAVDHGIETPSARAAAGKSQTATIMLRARQRASEFRLEVSDDGRGLDAEAIRAKAVERGLVGEAESRGLSPDRIYRFVFAPGFSTAATVTETSGRGVGMDVVMHAVTRLGGRIDIRTEDGVGTTFILRLPLSAAVLPALLVEITGQTFAIPERNIVAVEEIAADRLRHAGGRRVLLRGNVALPLHPLAGLLGMAQAAGKGGGHAVVVASGSATVAVEVDRLLRRQELLLRDLHPALAALPGVGGAALLGDGSPILVLDVDALVELARTGGRRREARAEAAS